MATISHVPTQSDPIFAAIAAHRGAFDALQLASEGRPVVDAAAAYAFAGESLMTAACSTRFGALALLEHLAWWIEIESASAAEHQQIYRIAVARAADLLLFLGSPIPLALAGCEAAAAASAFLPTPAPLGRPLPACDRYRQNAPSALPNEPLPGKGETWAAVAPVRPDTAHVRAPRFLDRVGELLAALALLGGGAVLTGFATLF